MNEEAEKTIFNTIDGFQWILGGVVIILILYLIFKNLRDNK
jgi:hypothetical protein